MNRNVMIAALGIWIEITKLFTPQSYPVRKTDSFIEEGVVGIGHLSRPNFKA